MTEPAPRPEIERALRFIAAHLDAPITVADVARAAHLSEFHFHRVFHAVVGEPIGWFITRRRLAGSFPASLKSRVAASARPYLRPSYEL